MHLLIVLDDGETFGPAVGSRIIAVPEGWSTERIEEALAVEDAEIETVVEHTPNLLSMIAAQAKVDTGTTLAVQEEDGGD